MELDCRMVAETKAGSKTLKNMLSSKYLVDEKKAAKHYFSEELEKLYGY